MVHMRLDYIRSKLQLHSMLCIDYIHGFTVIFSRFNVHKYLRLDDMQESVLMICNVHVDDIHAFGVIMDKYYISRLWAKEKNSLVA